MSALDVLAVLEYMAQENKALRRQRGLSDDTSERFEAEDTAAIAAVRELVEAARLARPAGEVGWPSARILEPAHAARLVAALAAFPEPQS